jgi:oleandomycin transport system permease protein
MFTLLFVYIFGGAVSGSTQDYMVLIIPGLIGQSIAFGSVGIGIQLNADIEKGIFDRFKSLPISRVAPLVGAALGDIIRHILLIVVMLGSGYALGYRITTDVWHALAAAALAIVFAMSLAWAPMLVGLIARSQRAVQGIVFMTLFPLTFASNAFVPTETMPGWLKAFSDANPISHLVGAMRAFYTGGPWLTPTLMTLAWSAGFVLVFAPLAIRAYNRRA